MSAIVTALRSPTITRLELTYNQLSRIPRRMIGMMDALLDPNDNHSAYVATLNDSHSLPCIPFVGKHVPH
jgi:hypothetical protein